MKKSKKDNQNNGWNSFLEFVGAGLGIVFLIYVFLKLIPAFIAWSEN